MPDERRLSPNSLAMLAMTKPVASHVNEAKFQQWYKGMAEQLGLNPDPDADEQKFDYRAAMLAGDSPNVFGHWKSEAKAEGHPTEVVNGFNVHTQERVPGAPIAGSAEEMIIDGWDPQTAQHLWNRVKGRR